MHKNLSIDLSNNCLNSGKNLSVWDEAISDAEKQIEDAKQRIATLKSAIKTFQGLRDSGASFPSEKPKQRSRKVKRSEAKT